METVTCESETKDDTDSSESDCKPNPFLTFKAEESIGSSFSPENGEFSNIVPFNSIMCNDNIKIKKEPEEVKNEFDTVYSLVSDFQTLDSVNNETNESEPNEELTLTLHSAVDVKMDCDALNDNEVEIDSFKSIKKEDIKDDDECVLEPTSGTNEERSEGSQDPFDTSKGREENQIKKHVKVCKHCGYSFSTAYRLRRHVQSVHEKKPPLSCLHCESSFAVATSLRRHVETVHNNSRPYVCSLCKSSFNRPAYLRHHVESVHENRRPYSCLQCDLSFTKQGNLKMHIETVHEKKRPYVCLQCKISYSSSKTLKYHILAVHEKKRPYECLQCKSSFTQPDHLKAHIDGVHEKKRPHVCLLCKFSSSKATRLKEHIEAVHEKKRPHVCLQCTSAFSRAGDLRRHIRSVHKVNE